MSKLENWALVSTNPYLAPEASKLLLTGNVYNHPKFKDGESVTTSPIDRLENDFIITYSGSKYELGEIDPQYEKLFPNAKERLFNSLKRRNNNA